MKIIRSNFISVLEPFDNHAVQVFCQNLVYFVFSI
jgi:hypothetical protein